MTAIAQVVRDEVGKALKGNTPPPVQAPRRQNRRESRCTLPREVSFEAQSSLSVEPGEEDRARRGRVTDINRPGTRVVPGKIVAEYPLYKNVLDCETYGLVNKSSTYSNNLARTLGPRKKHVAQYLGPDPSGKEPHPSRYSSFFGSLQKPARTTMFLKLKRFSNFKTSPRRHFAPR